ncbi:type II toxin-antitoxin system RelE/ParE family toxin [Pelotomaculum sp. FP]|uniref:type II toxin-antitoxin system RelE/ParE family toxin n=1 Tax=Pelotomaculum sp. FP TaxID=261474 RepID=UPI001864B99D|nr:type II toxin-antitoxin system RelE/ParE family toxin [Pelotomaculum sp. FP]
MPKTIINNLHKKLSSTKNIIISEEVYSYLLNHHNPKVAAKIIRNIILLDEFGLNLPVEYIHRIWASKEKLWELRTKFSNNAERTLFFTVHEGKFLLTNCFRKDTDDVPKNEIRKAKKNPQGILKIQGVII